MKRAFFGWVLAASLPTVAQAGPTPDSWYVGAALGSVELELSNFKSRKAYIGLDLGARVNRFLSVEFGGYTSSFSRVQPAFDTPEPQVESVHVNGVLVSVLGHYPVREHISIDLRLAYSAWRLERDLPGDADGGDFWPALGGSWRINSFSFLRLEHTLGSLDDADYHITQIAYRRHFGLAF